MDATKLIAYLSFDTSPTVDLCGGTWTAIGSPTVSNGALQLDGASCLKLNGSLSLGGQDFTIHGWARMNSSAKVWAGLFALNGNKLRLIRYNAESSAMENGVNGSVYKVTTPALTERFHFAYIYQHATGTWKTYFNGVCVDTRTNTLSRTTYANVFIGGNGDNSTTGGLCWGGSIDEFMIYDGVALYTENFTPPTADDYVQLKLALGSSAPLNFIADVERNVYQSRTSMSKFLSFTGNSGCYASLPLDVLAGATSFTIEAKFSTTSTKNTTNNWTWGTIAGREIGDHWQDDFGFCVNDGKLCFWAEPKSGGSDSTKNTTSSATVNDGQIHKVAVVSSGGAIDLYCDGVKVAHTDNVNAKISTEQTILLASDSNANSYLQMDLYELRFWNVARTQAEIFADIDGTETGLRAWYLPSEDGLRDYSGNGRHATLYGSPALNELYTLPVTLTADLQRKLSNNIEVNADLERILRVKWRYFNAGTADTLTISGTTLTDLPESQSRTGSAFYQRTRAKCFDIPATNEIWIKFDVYFNGSNRWRAYNDGDNGSIGATAQTNGDFNVWVNDSSVGAVSNICIANQLQTVLLHMISDSTNGVIEAWVDGSFIYSYTGDVNHGSDFADFYLQSDGANTFFSNVIISNYQIGLNDGYQNFSADVERRVSNRTSFNADIVRNVKNKIPFAFSADLLIKDVLPILFCADLVRRIVSPFSFVADIELLDVVLANFSADLQRNILTTLELFATDNSDYFSGGGSTPIVIPTQKVIPPAAQNTTGLQSVEISISEQQITDAVKFSGIIPFDIMFPVVGLYLDYVYNMRVEKVQRQGVLYSCDCCSNLDELLFTQLDYSLAQKTTWYQEDANGNEQEIETYYPPASEHVQKIADALGLIPVLQFDDFLSTVLQDDVGGRTYNDLIRDIFGWSSRIPTHLINVFIRNGKLFVIQRGHEANLIDISGADMTLPVITHELVRTTWGSKPWSATEVVGKLGLDVPDDKVVGSSQDDEEDTWVTVQDVSYGIDWQAVTTYFYYQKMLTVVDPDSPVNKRAGLLYKVEINKTYAFGVDKPDSFTQIFHEYDEDRNKIQTITDVQYLGFISGELPPDTRTINQMHYITLPNGEKFLASESTQTYEDDKLVDSTFTSHSPSRLGQTHVIKLDDDGDIVGEVVGQDTGDDRVTPFSESKAAEFLNSLPDKQQIIDGLPLFDSSFPIHNQDKLIELTEALKWLNRKTCETVTLSIYGFPHLINFNDRILLNGNEFFLVSNNAKTTPRIFNEQNLTLRRWF